MTFSDGVLTINARRKKEREKREGEYLGREMVFGNLQRRIGMPGDVQADNIRATFDNGVLRVEVPRAEKPQPRRIEVQPGQQADQGQPTGDGQPSDQAQTSGEAQTGDQARKESSETSGSETVGSSASRS